VAPPAVVGVDLLESRRDYVDALGRGDRRRATEIAFDLLYLGVPADAVLTELIGVGQEDVGLAWQDGRWDIAQEHRASAVAEAVIQAVTQQAQPPVLPTVGGARGRVTVACSEGEWHVLPSRLASEVLRLRGFDVDFVAPSVPADELARFLGPGSPGVVAVSCSMPSSLLGAWRTITALRAAGKTIVCGGRGFGPGGAWGVALGADLGAEDLETGMALLDEAVSWPASAARPDAVPAEIAAEIALATRELSGMVEAATHLAVARLTPLGGDEAVVREARGMLAFTMRTVVAATLVGDHRIVSDHAAWAQALLVGRSRPTSLVAQAFELLAAAVPADLPRCSAAVRAGIAACSTPSSPGSARHP
jgi:MerR family transcriptional regulator, light-induced transcriptional regulator